MRGYKAKVLRRIAANVTHDNEPGYIYPKGRTHMKMYIDAMGWSHPYTVSGMAVVASEAHRLYKRMKKDLRTGGS